MPEGEVQRENTVDADSRSQAERNAASPEGASISAAGHGTATGIGADDLQRTGSQSSAGTMGTVGTKGMDNFSEVGLSSTYSSKMPGEGMPGSPHQPLELTPRGFLEHFLSHANSYVIRSSLLASISSALLGYDIGVTSGAMLFITESFAMNHVQQEVFVGILNLISLVGALISGRLADMLGRRLALLTASSIFFVGALMMSLAWSYPTLLVGRIITGIGIGFGLAIPPLYIAEIAPPANRGGLVSLGEVFINLGILLGFLTSFVLGSVCPPWLAWRLMLGGGSLLAVALGLSITGLPESPRWLIMHGRVGEGELVLLRTSNDDMEAQRRYWEILDAAGLADSAALAKAGSFSRSGSDNLQASLGSPDLKAKNTHLQMLELANMSGKERSFSTDGEAVFETPSHAVVKPMEGAGGHGVWKEFLWPTPPVRRMLIVLVGINFFQQATGIDATVYYSPIMFQQAGLKGTTALLGATLMLGFIKVFFVLVAVALLDRFGRRVLLLTSVGGMMFSLLAQGTGFLILEATRAASPDDTGLTWSAALAVLANCTFVAFFSLGMGPINWLLTSEIFPLRLRAQAIGLGTAVNRVAAGAVAMSFLSLEDATGASGPFFIFAGMCFLALIFFYFLAPETRGKSLEQIVKMFERPDYARVPENYELAPAGLAKMDALAQTRSCGNDSVYE